jgi:polysaccharide export outer membrane protein
MHMKFFSGFCRVGAVLAFVLLCGADGLRAAESSDYRISSGDKLFIDVFGEKDLQRDVAVSASGDFTFPLLGTVKAQGLTALQLQEKLKESLGRDFLVDPQVMVSVRDYKKRTISVLGQVAQPGLVELHPEQNLTILEAIAMRGGFAPSASKRGIQVVRPGVAQPYRFGEDELKRTTPDKVFILRQGDIITVQESIL